PSSAAPQLPDVAEVHASPPSAPNNVAAETFGEAQPAGEPAGPQAVAVDQAPNNGPPADVSVPPEAAALADSGDPAADGGADVAAGVDPDAPAVAAPGETIVIAATAPATIDAPAPSAEV